MEKKSDFHFSYPPNLHELDLATLVSMYRERGMPQKAKPGNYFACAATQRLIKNGKWWFGLYYSQEVWDKLLTKGCEGYPLTETELNVLGLVLDAGNNAVDRNYVEENCGTISKLTFMIINDLKEYGFLALEDNERLLITPRGEKALQGIARRIYGKKFSSDMLVVNGNRGPAPKMEQARKKEENDQANLFNS